MASILANGFAAEGWSVTLMTTDNGVEEPAYRLLPKVRYMPLSIEYETCSSVGAARASIRRIRIMRGAILGTASDVVISFLDRTNVLALLATVGSGIPVIVSERTDSGKRNIGLPWKILRRLIYPHADAVVCQGRRPLNSLPPSIARKTIIIPNPVTLADDVKLPSGEARTKTGPYKLIAMGTLKPEKGFDLLLQAFSLVMRDHPEWTLTIWGDGSERKRLEPRRSELGLAEKVRLPGATRAPFSELARGDLFVLSSIVEGFPNALAEAMAVGLPVIATDVGAVQEIVRNDLNGIVVPAGDVPALAAAMNRLMADKRLRCEMGRRAREVLNEFSPENVLAMWKNLIANVVAAKPMSARLFECKPCE